MIAIDWSQTITTEMKAAAEAAERLSRAQQQQAALRQVADNAIEPLQDAVDLGMATPEESAMLLAWKRYRVELSRVPTQAGYPDEITWPAPPA